MRSRIREPDLDASQRAFREMIAELSAEEQFDGVEVGNLFSDVMVISCAASLTDRAWP